MPHAEPFAACDALRLASSFLSFINLLGVQLREYFIWFAISSPPAIDRLKVLLGYYRAGAPAPWAQLPPIPFLQPLYFCEISSPESPPPRETDLLLLQDGGRIDLLFVRLQVVSLHAAIGKQLFQDRKLD